MTAQKLRFEPTIGPLDRTGRRRSPRDAPLRAPRRATTPRNERSPQLLSFGIAYLVVGLACGGLIISGVATEQGATPLGALWPYSPLVLCALTAMAGALLLAGRPLGWYLAALVVVDTLLAAAWDVQTLVMNQVPLALWLEGTLTDYANALLKAAVAGGVLLYLLGDAIREHCEMPRANAYLGMVLLLALEVALIVFESPMQFVATVLNTLPL